MRLGVAVLITACVACAAPMSPPPMPVPQPIAGATGGMDYVLGHILASPDLDGAIVGAADGPPGAQPAVGATIVVLFASWCSHCHDEIQVLDGMRAAHPGVRVIGVNYRGHEEYDARGDAAAVRRYVRTFAPWMRTVPIGDELFGELGRPPKIPTLYVYDLRGTLIGVYDRRVRDMPGAAELEQLFARLGV
jgi:thiol-disulfide isomerase/thioredoxin